MFEKENANSPEIMEEKKLERKKTDLKKLIFLFLPLALIYLYDYIGNWAIEHLYLFMDLFRLPFEWLDNRPAFLDAFSAIILSIVFYLLYLKLFSEKKKELSLTVWKGIFFGIVIGFGVGGLSSIWLNFVDFLSVKIPGLGNQLESFSGLYDDLESGPYIWTFLAIVAIGPLVEEILFRGLIFRSFEEVTDIPWFPLLFSGLMFGIWHGSFIQGVYTASMGIILGYFMKKSRSLLYVVVAHAINNLNGTLPPLLNTDLNNTIMNLLSYLCIIPMFCILFYLHKKGLKEQTIKEEFKIEENMAAESTVES